MASSIRVEGTWPDGLTISAGWFRAHARPWNDEVTHPMVRLDRGGAEFLASIVSHLGELGQTEVFSPALYRSATRVWHRAGFEEFSTLAVMERPLSGPVATAAHPVTAVDDPDWSEILEIDRHAFDGFWRMSRSGLIEAHGTNKSAQLLICRDELRTVGYAIVGTQWGVSYLHRIAVEPGFEGRGIGTSLLRESMRWGLATGGRSMVLNVRNDNQSARTVYKRQGFTDTGSDLTILRHPSRQRLD